MADPRLAELNRLLRQHEFLARSSLSTSMSSKRGAFEHDAYFFAQLLNLPIQAAEEEITKARKLYRKDLSNSDDSALCDEIDSSKILVSPRSRPTSPRRINPTDTQPGLLRSLPIDEVHQPREMPLDFGNSKHDPNLRSKKKASKKRQLEQADEDDHQAKQTITECDRTKRAKKAKSQVSEADHHDQFTKITQVSTSSGKISDLTAENEETKPDKKGRRRKKDAKAQRPEEVINKTDFEVSTRTEDFLNNIRTAGRQEQLSINPLRPRETLEPATEVNSMNEECKAKPPESKLLPDKEDSQAITVSQAEEDSHSPQFFHSPMIQSVGQLLMRRCLKMARFSTMNGNEEPNLEL